MTVGIAVGILFGLLLMWRMRQRSVVHQEKVSAPSEQQMPAAPVVIIADGIQQSRAAGRDAARRRRLELGLNDHIE